MRKGGKCRDVGGTALLSCGLLAKTPVVRVFVADVSGERLVQDEGGRVACWQCLRDLIG